MLWLVLGGIAALAGGILLFALLRRPRSQAARIEYDLEVYRAQLRELDRERDSGLISETEAKAARIEIQRRILAADQAVSAGQAGTTRKSELIPAAIIGAAVPLAAVALYLLIGSPGTPSIPFAGRPTPPAPAAATAQAPLPDVESMMVQLRQRLAQNPRDLRGWATLGRSEAAMGNFEAAVAAFERAIHLAGDQADLHGAKAEALIMAAKGQVTADARAALQRALELDPGDARARFYMALAVEQDGDLDGALERLTAVLEDAPADAPWYGVVHDRATALATRLGLDPAAALPAARAVAGQPAGDPRARVDDLAARLDRDPKDFRGWIELAQLRAAQGDSAGARQALDRGAQVYEGAPFVQQQLRQAAVELGLVQSADTPGTRGPTEEEVAAASQMTRAEQEEMIRGMVGGLAERLKGRPDDLQGWQMLARSYGVLGEQAKAVEAYRQVLNLDAENGDALFFLGEAAAQGGDTDAAAAYWTRLLAVLAPGSAEHTMVQERLERLKTAN